jgi:hypothetical protein
MKRVLKALGWLVLVLLVGVGVLVITQWHSPPTGGVSGPEADALAHSVEKAVGLDAWNKLGAIRWTWNGSGHKEHLTWDRKRNTVDVKWGKELEAMVDVAKGTGRAFDHGVELSGDAAKKQVESGLKRFYNDAFWLNPLAKLFDDGVTREKVTVDGKPALFIKYASGGATPGDRYLWMVGDDGVPVAWRTWVSVLKVKGLQFSWEDWLTLPNGAKVSTTHKLLGKFPAVQISDLAVADSYESLPK